MRDLLASAKEAVGRGDLETVASHLRALDRIFRQHIADEEAQILRILVSELGTEGAQEEIRIFQQHRPIYALMRTVAELASKGGAELSTEQRRLSEIFDAHASTEERRVFPRALDCFERLPRHDQSPSSA